MKILIGVGKSGGHIFPALSLAHCLDEKLEDIKIFFVGSGGRLEKKIFSKEKYPHFIIPAEAMPYRISAGYLKFLAKLILSLIKSWRILGKVAPDVVVGFGGAASGPLVFAARFKGILTIIHEQNIVPGRTNKILSNFVDLAAISFSRTGRFFARRNKIIEILTGRFFRPAEIVLTGNPIRKGRPDRGGFRRITAPDADDIKFTILVMGGSQGSSQLNELAWQVFSGMKKENRDRLRIIHITGEDEYQKIKERYRQMKFCSEVFPFCEEMEDIYSSSNLVLSRAGASTISEVTAYGLPSILMPYRFAVGHQLANARMLVDEDAAILIEEEKISPGHLKKVILGLMNNRADLGRLAGNSKRIGRPRADEGLAEVVIKLASKKAGSKSPVYAKASSFAKASEDRSTGRQSPRE